MAAKVRVPRNGLAIGGWKGTLMIDGSVLRVSGDDAAKGLPRLSLTRFGRGVQAA